MFLDPININDVPTTIDITESELVVGCDDSFKYTLEFLLRNRASNEFRCHINNRTDLPIRNEDYNKIKNDTLMVILTKEKDIHPVGYTRVGKFNSFFSDKADLFLDAPRRVSVVFLYSSTNIIDLKTFHHIQSAIPVMLPWYFEETELSDYELRFLKTLSSKNGASEYKQFIEETLLSKECRINSIKKMFKGFHDKEIMQRKSILASEIDQLNIRFRSAQRSLEDCLKKIMETEALYNQLQLAPTHEATDIENYMINNMDCIKVRKDDYGYQITIDSYYDNYDEEMLRAALKSENSCLSQGLTKYPNIKRVIEEIFLNHKAKLKARSFFELNTYRLGVNDEMPSMSNGDRIVNPHHRYYRCLGGFAPQIDEAIRTGDYITALELARAATGNINFMDRAVISRFIPDLVSNIKTIRCVETPDGSSLTIEDFYNMIEKGETDEQKTV